MARIQLIGRMELQRAETALKRAGAAAQPALRKFMLRGGIVARRAFRAQFATSGREFGSPWQPLQEVTIRRFKKQNQTRINVRTANLLNSITKKRNERIRGSGSQQTLVLIASAQAIGGGSTLTAIEAHPRGDKIRHPQTGIAGRGLDELDRAFRLYVRRLEKLF